MTQHDEFKDFLNQTQETAKNYLFHYTNLAAGLSIAIGNKLRFSSISGTNDPFEFINPQRKIDGISIRSANQQRILKELEISQNRRQNMMHLICLTQEIDWNESKCINPQTKPNNLLFKGWARTRMWSQYAAGSNGVCLIFDKKRLLEKVANQFGNSAHWREVEYTNDFSKIEKQLKVEINTPDDEKRDYSNYYLEESKMDCFFTKNEDSRDEQEFRILLKKQKEAEPFFIRLEDSLVGVVFGQNVDKDIYTNLSKLLPVPSFLISWEYGLPYLS